METGYTTPEHARATIINKLISLGGIETNDISDQYHTFGELYHHRILLYSVICKHYKEKSWKSRKHHDGTMYKDMFIVGIDTPKGMASYHINNIYWDMFDVRELEKSPEYDRYTADDSIMRITSLEPVT